MAIGKALLSDQEGNRSGSGIGGKENERKKGVRMDKRRV